MGFPGAPVPGAREHAGGRNDSGEVHVFPFPTLSSLYVHPEISGGTQNHLSIRQVPKEVAWTGRLRGKAEFRACAPRPRVLGSTAGTGLSCQHG